MTMIRRAFFATVAATIAGWLGWKKPEPKLTWIDEDFDLEKFNAISAEIWPQIRANIRGIARERLFWAWMKKHGGRRNLRKARTAR